MKVNPVPALLLYLGPKAICKIFCFFLKITLGGKNSLYEFISTDYGIEYPERGRKGERKDSQLSV